MKKILSCLLVMFVILSCTILCTAADVTDWSAKWDAAVSDSAVIALSPGDTETQMRFCWLSDIEKDNQFQIGQTSDLSDAKDVPVRQRFTVTGQKVCRVTADDLLPDTVYYYRYTKNGAWSSIFSFHTQGEQLTALFVSDAQLGRSGNWRSKDVLLHDVAGWDTTIEQGLSLYPDTSMILSAGDQAEKGFSEQEYRLFLAPDALRSVPIAPVVGNHEFYFPYLNLHFDLPNRIGDSIIHSFGDEPYYFARGNVLFIILESNNLSSWDHEAVLDRAVHTYPDAQWRVVMLHHSLYSCEDSETDAPMLRKTLTPLLQKYNVDLVLGGHTHRYSRSYPLIDGQIREKGIVYLEGGCASGCNSKASRDELPSYSAAGFPHSGLPVYCALQFSETEIKMTAYAVENGESTQIDAAIIQAHPRNDEAAQMSPIIRILHFMLSLGGKLFSVWYQ